MFRTEWKTQYQTKGDASQLARPSPNPRKGFIYALVWTALFGLTILSAQLYNAQQKILSQDRQIFYLESVERSCEQHLIQHHPKGEWK